MEIGELLTISGAVVIVTIVVEVAKRTLGLSDVQVTRFGPLLSIVAGIVTTVGAAVVQAADIPTAFLTGLLAGAAASGIYSYTKVR